MLTVGQRIKAIREQKGLTQKYVAKASGINVALLQKYEYGIRNPKDDQLKKIAEALGVEPVSLRPPKIENTAELLYALREISDRFGVVLIEDGGQSVHIKLDRLSLVSETDEDQPADNIKEARVKRISALTSESMHPKEKEYTDRELAIRYARALQTIRLVVKDKHGLDYAVHIQFDMILMFRHQYRPWYIHPITHHHSRCRWHRGAWILLLPLCSDNLLRGFV